MPEHVIALDPGGRSGWASLMPADATESDAAMDLRPSASEEAASCMA